MNRRLFFTAAMLTTAIAMHAQGNETNASQLQKEVSTFVGSFSNRQQSSKLRKNMIMATLNMK